MCSSDLSALDHHSSSQISGRWETEIVQDSNVFTSYLRQRQKMDDGKLDVDNLPLTNDSAENERLEKKLVKLLNDAKLEAYISRPSGSANSSRRTSTTNRGDLRGRTRRPESPSALSELMGRR